MNCGRVIGFEEKPAVPKPIPGNPEFCLASMGIYVFNAHYLFDELCKDATLPDSAHDFGWNIIPSMIHTAPVYCYRFYDENKKAAKYWRDIGTLDAYFDASMELCQVNPEFNLYDPEWPLRTYQPQAPPAKFVFAEAGRRCGQALDSVISPGCIVSGSSVAGSVLCPNVRVHSFCDVDRCILMPGVRVGRHARLRRAIIDRDVFIPRGARIGFNPEEDRRRHTVSDGGIVDWRPVVDKAHGAGAQMIVAADLLSLALVAPPGEFKPTGLRWNELSVGVRYSEEAGPPLNDDELQRRGLRTPNAIKVNADFNPGFGGGTLANFHGELMGVISLNLNEVGKFSLAIPVDYYRAYEQELKQHGRVRSRTRRPWLGVYAEEMAGHVVLVGVNPIGPAAKTGLRQGDIILSVENTEIRSRRELYQELWKKQPGERIRLRILRDDQSLTLEIVGADRAERYRS